MFARIEPALRKSITFDNDTAFAQHALLRTMRAMTTWFCDAYASWQKGGVENANGRLRRWLPRQIDIDQVSDEEIQDIVITANLTPRKCLGFKTPFQAILKELVLSDHPNRRNHLSSLVLESHCIHRAAISLVTQPSNQTAGFAPCSTRSNASARMRCLSRSLNLLDPRS